MQNVKKVLLGYNLRGPDTDLTDELSGEVLRVFLSNDTEVLIELFERQRGIIEISVAGGFNNQITILPVASNKIGVTST